ncbi:MAG: hypothetical protein RLZZ292_3449, partial [Bacteroidota bacterium]
MITSHHITSHHITSQNAVPSFFAKNLKNCLPKQVPWLMVLFLFSSTFVIGQNLITKVEMTELSTLEKASYDAIAKIDVISSMQVVQIGKIAEKQENGILKLTLPNSTETYTLKVSRAEYYDATNFVWVGERIDNELVQIIDYFTLFNEKGMIGGDFRLGTHFAKIVPLSE